MSLEGVGVALPQADPKQIAMVVPKVKLLKLSGAIYISVTGGAAARAGALGSTQREEIAMYRSLFARDVFA